MFKNITDNIMWDYTREAVKTLDLATPQIDGKGQTQRYLEIIGGMLRTHFEKITELYNAKDADRVDEATLDSILFTSGLKYIPEDLPLESKRHLAKYYDYMSSLIGTRVFVDWILWMVLGWRVVSISKQVATNLLGTFDGSNPPEDVPYIYDPTKGEAQFILFDQNAVWSLVVLVNQGSSDPNAFDWVNANMEDWILSQKIDYV